MLKSRSLIGLTSFGVIRQEPQPLTQSSTVSQLLPFFNHQEEKI